MVNKDVRYRIKGSFISTKYSLFSFYIKILIRILILLIHISIRLFKEIALLCLRLSFAMIFIYSSIFFSMILQFLTFFKFLKKYSENSYTQKLLSSLSGFPGRYPRSYVFILFYSNVKKRRNVLKIFSLLGLYFLLVKLSEVDWFLFFFLLL